MIGPARSATRLSRNMSYPTYNPYDKVCVSKMKIFVSVSKMIKKNKQKNNKQHSFISLAAVDNICIVTITIKIEIIQVYSLKLQIIKSNIRTIQLFFATIVKTQNIKYNVIIHVPQQPDPFAKTVLLELNSILVFQSYLTCIQIINW